jgi:hypothetical protein
MATILLRRVTQIANRIKTETAFEVEQEDDYSYGRRRAKKIKTLNPQATISIDGDPNRRVAALRENLLSRKNQILRLMEIATRIRTAMAVKQAECGVTALVTKRVGLINRQKILEYLIDSTATNTLNEKEFNEQCIAMRQRLANATGGVATADIPTVLLTDNDHQQIQIELGAVKRELLDIDDKLAQLNSSNSIEVNDEDEAYLRDLSIA